MAKAKKRVAKKKITPGVDAKARSAEEIQRVRNRVRNVIMDRSVEMAERVAQSVTEGGQVTALKYLWEAAGLFPADAEEENGEQDSLAKVLLERMGLADELPASRTEAEGDVESDEGQNEE
jgi:hypothetical protein